MNSWSSTNESIILVKVGFESLRSMYPIGANPPGSSKEKASVLAGLLDIDVTSYIYFSLVQKKELM